MPKQMCFKREHNAAHNTYFNQRNHETCILSGQRQNVDMNVSVKCSSVTYFNICS